MPDMMPTSYRNLVCDTIEVMSSLSSVSQLGATFAEAMAKLGFCALGINVLPLPGEDTDPVILTERAPEGFRDLYVQERFYAVDHLVVHARTTCEPFRYRDAPYTAEHSQRHERFIQALDKYGIGRGVVIPIGRMANIPACVWLAGKNPELHDNAILTAQLTSLFATNKVQALSRRPDAAPASSLTKREREVLQWISVGKTSWEISVISGTSERAINAIIAGAMNKLNAVTRVQAVANAIRQGQIEL